MTLNAPLNKTSQNNGRFSLHLIYPYIILFLILSMAISLIAISDYRRFEKNFTNDTEKLQTQFNFYIRQSEAVLEGLSAFVAGIGGVNDEMLDHYAKKVKARFPYIYMLEVAEEVKKENLESFIREHRKKGHEDFDVRSFAYFEKRGWAKLPKADKYFPLTYLYPLEDKSRKVLGLDLSTNEHLGSSFRKALKNGRYETSLPFNLIEGDKAVVMFKAVEYAKINSSASFMALIVITTDGFILDAGEIDDSLGLLVYHNTLTSENNNSHFILKGFEESALLPRLVFETTPESKQAGLVLQITKQFQLRDISWVLFFIIISLLLFAFFIIKNISAKNRAEQEKAQEILHQKNKMMAISTLTGGIAHEFNNNLSVVRGFLNLLAEKNQGNEESLSWIEYVETASEKCISLTHKLLVFSRYQGVAERVSGIDINDIISTLNNELQAYVKNTVRLTYHLAENLPHVLLSEEDFKEIVFNMVENASEAIKAKGEIIIKTSFTQLSGDEEIESGVDTVAGEYVQFSISDTGIGINKEIKMHIFDPFFTTKSFGEGAGMGLAIVYGLVKLNKGYLSFSSECNEGSTFNIFLPVINK